MDKLDDLFARQKKLQEYFGNELDNFNEEDRQQYTKDNILGLLDETHEILRETNWKHWRKTKKDISREDLLEELADAFHFYINLCLAWGFSADELHEAYLKKDEEIYRRIDGDY